MTPVPFRAKPGTMDSLATPTGGVMPMLRWLITGGGPFATLTGQAFAFVKSTDTKCENYSKQLTKAFPLILI